MNAAPLDPWRQPSVQDDITDIEFVLQPAISVADDFEMRLGAVTAAASNQEDIQLVYADDQGTQFFVPKYLYGEFSDGNLVPTGNSFTGVDVVYTVHQTGRSVVVDWDATYTGKGTATGTVSLALPSIPPGYTTGSAEYFAHALVNFPVAIAGTLVGTVAPSIFGTNIIFRTISSTTGARTANEPTVVGMPAAGGFGGSMTYTADNAPP